MWPLTIPNFADCEVFGVTTSKLRNINGLVARLDLAKIIILAEWEEFADKGHNKELHQFVSNDVTAGTISKGEMIRLYDSGLRRFGGPGRPVYDGLMALAPNRRCPYCGHRRVGTLDHFLPQAKYPVFSVAPLNLVPCCIECNKDKKADDPGTLEETILHPYFESIDDVTWLRANIIDEGGIAVFLFEVDRSSGLEECTWRRAENQLKSLSLGELYTIESNDLLSSIRLNLRGVFAASSHAGVKAYLKSEWQSSKFHRRNAWQTAFYRAAYKSNWFCNGGFDDPDLL